jgi:hypothetical protein
MMASIPRQLPLSWLYVGFGGLNLWRRLNLGDRVFLVGVICFAMAVAIGFGLRLTGFLQSALPAWMQLGIGAYVSGLVIIGFNLPMMAARSHRFERYLPESTARRTWRVGLEFGFSVLACVAMIAIQMLSVAPVNRPSLFVASVAIAIGLQGCWYVAQLVAGVLPQLLWGQNQATGTHVRSRMSAIVIVGQAIKSLPATSSRFLLKANNNPIVWLSLILTALASGGAIFSTQNPLLWTLSGVSTLLLIAQLALMEPRVGNGAVLGAHSLRTPIKRGVSDLCALALPHLCLMVLAVCALVFAQNWVGILIALTQGIVTVWALWLGLLIKALPPQATTKHALWLVVGGMIAGQFFPPLIVVLVLAITIALTRDLNRQTMIGPALWPRP